MTYLCKQYISININIVKSFPACSLSKYKIEKAHIFTGHFALL